VRMPSFVPREIDDYFFLDILLIFLMINFNMPLATIYLGMVLVGSMMYYVATDKGFFRPIPAFNKKGLLMPIVVGVGLGVAYIWVYALFNASPIANIFATTAFGDSQLLGKLVFGILIDLVETRFLFRTMMQWFAWKTKTPLTTPFSKHGIILMIFFGGVFTIFHATAKGITNTPDLMATFLFGALSVGMIIQLKRWIEAAIMHIVVNSHGVGLIDELTALFTTGAIFTNVWFLLSLAIFIFWLYKTGKLQKLGIKIPTIG